MKLVIEDGAGTRSAVPFSGDEITLGRAAEGVTFRLADRNVSRQHARFVSAAGVVFVEDMGSLTGTRVNGERISARRKVREGDLVQIGDYDLAIFPDDAPGETAPPPLPPQPSAATNGQTPPAPGPVADGAGAGNGNGAAATPPSDATASAAAMKPKVPTPPPTPPIPGASRTPATNPAAATPSIPAAISTPTKASTPTPTKPSTPTATPTSTSTSTATESPTIDAPGAPPIVQVPPAGGYAPPFAVPVDPTVPALAAAAQPAPPGPDPSHGAERRAVWRRTAAAAVAALAIGTAVGWVLGSARPPTPPLSSQR